MERFYFFLYYCHECKTWYEKTVTLKEDHNPKQGFKHDTKCYTTWYNSRDGYCPGTLQLVKVEVKII